MFIKGQQVDIYCIDCAIAIIALENNLQVLHYDRDFEAIGKHTTLKQKNIKQQLSIT